MDAFRAGGGLAWLGLYRPTEEEFAAVAAEFGLHELAVEDAVHPHQRPKFERRYGDILFCVLRPARDVDETETVEQHREVPGQVLPDSIARRSTARIWATEIHARSSAGTAGRASPLR
jgi:Mg2+ and Co2+ transporter CorA